jgi:hypothetical protein
MARVDEPGALMFRHWTSQLTTAFPVFARAKFMVGVLRVTPAGKELSQMMSEGIVRRLTFPLPIFHSPKATVLLVPSVILAIPRAGPRCAKTPLGGPPV